MKKSFAAAFVLCALGASGLSAAAAPVCLYSHEVKNTDTPDARTIIFHMLNGDVWRNTLQNACPDLKFNGYVMTLHGEDQICEKQQVIRTIESGQVCMLGKFEKVVPDKPKPGP